MVEFVVWILDYVIAKFLFWRCYNSDSVLARCRGCDMIEC